MRACFLLLVLCATSAPARAQVPVITAVYVDDSAPGPAQDGTSWLTAYHSLQDALATTPDPIGPNLVRYMVAEGTYYPADATSAPGSLRARTFLLGRREELYGGWIGAGGIFSADPNLRDGQVENTVLSGDIARDGVARHRSHHVVTVDLAAGEFIQTDRTRLDGLTIRDGNAESFPDQPDSLNIASGGGILHFGPAGHATFLEIRGCLIVNNHASLHGGGLFSGGGSLPDIEQPPGSGLTGARGGRLLIGASSNFGSTRFKSNTAGVSGGAIRTDRLAAGLQQDTFNLVGELVPGLLVLDSSIWNTEFSRNLAPSGGAVHVGTGSPAGVEFYNCSFFGGVARRGGAIHAGRSEKVKISNCSFGSNLAVKRGGALYFAAGASRSVVANSIFHGNRSLEAGPDIDSAYAGNCNDFPGVISNNVFETSPAVLAAGTCSGTVIANNVLGDPEWTHPLVGDFTLGAGSLAIDHGDAVYQYRDRPDLDANGNVTESTPLDLSGSPRVSPAGATIDSGAHERP